MASPQHALDATSDFGRLGSSHSETGGSQSLWSQFARSIPVIPAFCVLLVFLTTFANTLDIGLQFNPNEPRAGHGAQQAIKLALGILAMIVGVAGVSLNRCVRQALFSPRGTLLLSLAFVLIATSIFAIPERAMESIAAALLFLTYLCFTPTAITALGIRGFLFTILASLTFFMLVSWGLYLLVPSIGVFIEILDADTLVNRMGGLGHPNGIGAIAALAGVLSTAMLRSRELMPRFSYAKLYLASVIILSIATLYATFSRTAMISAGIAICFLWIDHIWTRNGLAFILVALSVALLGLFAAELGSDNDALSKLLLSTTTKTGDVTELTSATGRTAIWTEVIRLIAQRPWTGWGLEAAPVLLVDHSFATHNALLHVTLAGGLVAGGILAMLLLWSLVYGLRDIEPIIRATSAFILISCLVESTILDAFPGPTTVLWIFTLLYQPLRQFNYPATENLTLV